VLLVLVLDAVTTIIVADLSRFAHSTQLSQGKTKEYYLNYIERSER
jgi:hypothetical protein